MSEKNQEAAGTLEGFNDLSSEDFVNNLLVDVSEKIDAPVTTAPTIKKDEPAAAPETPAAPVVEKKDDTPAEPKAPELLTEEEKNKKAAEEKDASEKAATEAKAKEKSDAFAAAQKTLDDALAAAKTPEEKAAAQKAFDDAKLAIDPPAKPAELEFKLPEEKAKEAEDGDGWLTLAKEQGIEIPEDSFEAYTKGLDEHYKKKYEVDLGKFDPEAQRLIEFLNAGGTVDAFVDPLKPVNDLRRLSDVELLEKEFELRGWKPELIEKEITRMTEANEIDLAAFKVREQLDLIEKNIQKDVIDKKLQTSQRSTLYKDKSVAEDLANFKKELNTVSDFLEIPLKDKHKQYIAKKMEDGQYADLLNSPKAKILAILHSEFGKDGVSLLKQKERDEVDLKYKHDRHAIPPVPVTGGGQIKSPSQSDVRAEGNWGALEGFNEHTFKERN